MIYRAGDNVGLSARSLGDINVQVLMEALGGGGNSTTAGGTVPGAQVAAVKRDLLRAIDKYFDD